MCIWKESGQRWGGNSFALNFTALYNSFKNVHAPFDKKQNNIKPDLLISTPVVLIFPLDFEQRWTSCLEFHHYINPIRFCPPKSCRKTSLFNYIVFLINYLINWNVGVFKKYQFLKNWSILKISFKKWFSYHL